MMRGRIKAGAAQVMCRTGMDKAMGSLSGGGRTPLVIGYHRVVEDFAVSAETSIPSLLVSRGMLERHLDWIGRRYQFVDLNELGVLLESRRAPKKPVAAITFDDGYQDFYDHALPSLQKKGVPAALFVVTDFVGRKRVQIHDKLYLLLTRRQGRIPLLAGSTPYRTMRGLIESCSLYELQEVVRTLEEEDSIPDDAYSYSVTWETLERIQRAGVVIGSHTKTHVVMTKETRECVVEEAAGSRWELERRLRTTVQHFAYPSGIYDSASVRAVAAAGYRFGYTTCTHRSSEHPLLTVPRTLLWENSCLDSVGTFSEAVMNCQVRGAFDLMSRCRQQHAPVAGEKRQMHAAL
jgi:peptidoglycan/xylan/chitin deacetylase (PgdA/CDA1 family)